MYGKKRLYAWGVVVFTLGSLLCGLAANIGWLIVARAVQALGGVLIQSLGMAIITQIFPANERGRALGVVGGIVSTGLALGPALGGLIIGTLGLALDLSDQRTPGFYRLGAGDPFYSHG
jgi:MFS family permease